MPCIKLCVITDLVTSTNDVMFHYAPPPIPKIRRGAFAFVGIWKIFCFVPEIADV